MLNRKYKTSFKFILKGKKLSNINKAALIIGPFIKAISKVRGSFIVNDFKIIRYKVYYLTSLTTL
jgi:alkyl hydroperoxide reductase subunit AhpC